MADEIRSAQSLEYVRVQSSMVDVNGDPADPTGSVVSMAFVTEGAGVDGATSFINGTWETDTSDPANPIYYGRVLVGPSGAYVPAAGTAIDVYVKIAENPEIPIRRTGTIRFT